MEDKKKLSSSIYAYTILLGKLKEIFYLGKPEIYNFKTDLQYMLRNMNSVYLARHK